MKFVLVRLTNKYKCLFYRRSIFSKHISISCNLKICMYSWLTNTNTNFSSFLKSDELKFFILAEYSYPTLSDLKALKNCNIKNYSNCALNDHHNNHICWNQIKSNLISVHVQCLFYMCFNNFVNNNIM